MSSWISNYGFAMALVYPAVNVALLIACLYAARNSSFRFDFLLLAAAAFLSFIAAAIMLLVRLAHDGALSLPSSRQSLLLPHDICEIASIVLYVFGFIRLAYHVGSSARATRQV